MSYYSPLEYKQRVQQDTSILPQTPIFYSTQSTEQTFSKSLQDSPFNKVW